MEANGLVQRGNTLKVELTFTNSRQSEMNTILSPEYVINGVIVFQVRVMAMLVSDGYTDYVSNNFVFIRFTKRHQDNKTYSMKLTSTKLGLNNLCLATDDSTWRLVNENKYQKMYTIDVAVQIDMASNTSTFSPLHEDTKLVDFELRGTDGSVSFHKAVLAASSPVLKQMFEGTWRETSQGHVDVPETSKNTIQHLKDYMYLHALPDKGLEQLLLLSSYYMMPELEQRCVDSLVNNLSAQNACELLEFAAKHGVPRLLLAILECVQKCSIDVDEMRDYILPGEKINDAGDMNIQDNIICLQKRTA